MCYGHAQRPRTRVRAHRPPMRAHRPPMRAHAARGPAAEGGGGADKHRHVRRGGGAAPAPRFRQHAAGRRINSAERRGAPSPGTQRAAPLQRAAPAAAALGPGAGVGAAPSPCRSWGRTGAPPGRAG